MYEKWNGKILMYDLRSCSGFRKYYIMMRFRKLEHSLNFYLLLLKKYKANFILLI